MADAAEPAAEAPKKEKGGDTATFPRNADYQIHVFIDKAKEMLTPENDTIDPMFQVECLGLKEFSSAKDEVSGLGETVWGEHIFLEPRNIDQKDAESAKITIRLMDKGLFKNALIGMYEFDLSYIYLSESENGEKHAMEHKWLALNNPGSENYMNINGYVKVSISVIATGDEQVELKQEAEEKENPDILMSPSLNPTFYQVKIRIFQGQDLPPMDAGMMLSKPKIDAYIRINFKKKILKSKVLKFSKGGDPIDWNTEFLLPCQLPVLEPSINIRLMDEDMAQDEMAGSICIPTKELLENEYMHSQFTWKSFYGSPLNQSGSEAKTEMNRNPDTASQWKGRVLIQTIVEQCEKPKQLVRPVEQEVVTQAQEYLRNRKYKMIAQIGQAVALPTNKPYSIKITLGGHETMFEPMPQKNPSNYKRYGKCDEQEIELPFVNAADFGKVIFQLMDDDDPICFYVAHVKDFLSDREGMTDEEKKNGPRMQWVQFLPDMVVRKVKEPHLAGIFSFRLEIHDVEKNGPFELKTKKVWKQKVAKRANPVKIRAYIYLCRGLPAADKNGTSDPYILAWDTVPEKKKTEIIEDNNNPLYYETLELDYEVENQDDLESYPPFIFDVYDSDSGLLDSTDDFLARAIIEPEDCALITQEMLEKHNNDELAVDVEPRWHGFYFAAGEPMEGEVLVAFSVVEHDYNFKWKPENVDLNSRVAKSEYNVNMLILGLRNLQSPGILPVKKAFIHFKCKSIVPAGTASISDVYTNPTSPGPNPTINTTIKIKIPLPLDPLYCPNLTCIVYDQIFKGWNQPQVGVFTLNIGELMEALKAERKEETEVMFQILEKLKEIVKNPDMSIPSYGGTAQIQSTTINKLDDTAYSGYSDDDPALRNAQKQNQKVRKRAQKEMQDNENAIELTESLGANEQTGKISAQQQKAELLKKQQLIRSKIQKDVHAAEERDQLGSARAAIESGSEDGDVLKRKETLNKFEMLQQLREASEIEKQIQEDERKAALEEMNRQGDQGVKMIVMPQYGLDRRLNVMREVNPPSDKLFIGLGWDEDEKTKRKHYRQYITDELENYKLVFDKKSPFDSFDIMRGSSRSQSSTGLFSTKKTDASEKIKKVGYFKGIIQIESYPDRDAYRATKKQIIDDLKKLINDLSMKTQKEPLHIDSSKLVNLAERDKFETNMRKLRIDHLNISKHLVNLESDTILKLMLQNVTKEIIRIYMVEAFDLSSRDNGSASDPYLKITCNGQVVDERENYQIDCPNPKFYQKFDFEGQFPGTSPISIAVYDWDAVFGDELIGESILDVEDRYFNLEWVNLNEKPIEYRQIYHPSSSMSQGVVKLWMEIIPADRKEATKEWDISLKPPAYFEIRICVLNCKDIPLDSQGMVDAYFRGFFDSNEEAQETDTHFRCSDGKPDFQYRWIFKIAVPRDDFKFTIQCMDRDFFSSNNLIGEAQIDLNKIIEDCSLIKKPLTLNKKYYEEAMMKDMKSENTPNHDDKSDPNKFWLKLMGKNKKGKIDCVGQFRLQVDVLPIDVATKNPVAKARDEPNHSPALPKPEGRIELSINPLKMLNQFLGPEMMRKIYMFCALGVCVALCIMMLPMMMSQLLVSCLAACL